MKIFEKGTSVHATEIFYVKSTKLYVDEAKEVEAKRSDVLKAVQSGKLLVNNGTSFLTVTSVKLDGSQVVVGETTYNIAADA